MNIASSTLPPAGESGQSLLRVSPFEVEDMAFSMIIEATSSGRLDATLDEILDRTDFGIVVLSRNREVVAYNKVASAFPSLDMRRVIGRPFFTSVAPCTKNALIARRFETEAVLDELINYIFTFQMAPAPVCLRLVKHPDARWMYLFVKRRLTRDG